MTRVNCTHWCFVSQNSKTGALDTLSTISPPTDKDDKSSTNPPSNRTTRSRRFPEPNVVLRCDGDRYRVRSRHVPDPGAAEWGNDRPLARTLGSARPRAPKSANRTSAGRSSIESPSRTFGACTRRDPGIRSCGWPPARRKDAAPSRPGPAPDISLPIRRPRNASWVLFSSAIAPIG